MVTVPADNGVTVNILFSILQVAISWLELEQDKLLALDSIMLVVNNSPIVVVPE